MNGTVRTAILALCVLLFLPSPFVGAVESPTHPGAPQFSARQKAEYLLARKQYEQALPAYKSLLKNENEDSALFRGLVKAYQGLGQLKEAEGYLKDHLSRHTESSAVHYGLGYIYYLEGDDIRAQMRFEEAVRLEAGNALAWNNWGASLSRTKSYTLAVAKVKEAIRLESSNPMYYNNLRRIYREMGSTGLFIADYKRYIKDGPRLVAQGYGRLIAKTLRQESFKHYSEGNLSDAVRKFEEIIIIYKETGYRAGLVPIYFGLAVLHEELGDAEDAQKYLKEVLSINPNHLQAREKIK
jgi:tetratricopeptide (TPR) repeat protein